MKIYKILIFMFIILVLSTFTTSCFASFDFNYNDVLYSLNIPSEVFDYDFFIMKNPTTGYFFIYSPLDFDSIAVDDWISYFSLRSEDGGNTWNGMRDGSLWITNTSIVKMTDFSDIIYSTKDIKDINGNVVFQKPPEVEYQIPVIQETTRFPEVVREIVKVIIPIGLSLFGMLFVIFLIRYLKCFCH